MGYVEQWMNWKSCDGNDNTSQGTSEFQHRGACSSMEIGRYFEILFDAVLVLLLITLYLFQLLPRHHTRAAGVQRSKMVMHSHISCSGRFLFWKVSVLVHD